MEEDKIQNNIDDPKVIHTYMSDMAEAVRQNEVSVIKVALEEQKKREREEYIVKKEGTPKKKLFWVISGIFITLVALVISYFVIQKEKEKTEPLPIIEKLYTLLSYETQKIIPVINTITVTDFSNLIKNELSEKGDPQSIKSIYLRENIGEVVSQFSLENLWSLIGANSPNSLFRSFSNEYMLGSYTPTSVYDKNHLFLIIKVNDYNQAYAGMLEWEKIMLNDLYSLFQINTPTEDLFIKPFKDIFIKNKDARILYTNEGVDVLIYFFQDKNTLIITDSQETAKEIIDRLLAKQTK